LLRPPEPEENEQEPKDPDPAGSIWMPPTGQEAQATDESKPIHYEDTVASPPLPSTGAGEVGIGLARKKRKSSQLL
jgi:hypothetical protein